MSKKKDIMDVATRLFSQRGFRETSMADLSKLTGVAQGTIFYHFENKEKLFLSILEEFKDDITREFERYIAGRTFETGLEMMEDAISFYLYLAGAMEDRFLLLHRHDAYELARVNPVCRKHLESIYSCLSDIFEQAIIRGQEDGSVGPVPAKKTALIIFAMVDGLVRFNTYSLYDAGALSNELIESCRRILSKQ
ncbi:Transcriptional regulator [uncultured Desulfobacterium sp.]|uniref:Transcriptional regulator n=1 Tax=uncultured Desulfobacterium sp. TaxID=201089 RepID=A0A445N2B5_9BACT|nr:Transcriptional regulator [uncultured Desulfobacterium sp.]